MVDEFDVIVVGSGMTGGWAAKEFCEKGFKTLVLERGRHLDHPSDEYTDMQTPWEFENRGWPSEIYDEQGRYRMLKKKSWPYWSQSLHFFVDEKEYPYSYPEDRPYMWTRSYHLGGRSLTWGRQSFRWGKKDFEANAKDGHGVAWPIGYDDLEQWYGYVEKFVGISGNRDGLEHLPDGEFQKSWKMSCVEQHVSKNLKKNMPDRDLIIGRPANLTEVTEEQAELGRGVGQARVHCAQGCSFGAYFSSLSATIPAAKRTGNLTIVTDAIVSAVNYDPVTGKAAGVCIVDHNTHEKRTYKARVVFMCASSLGTVQILLNSKSARFPNGIGNSSGTLGRYLMDHFGTAWANGRVPGFEDRYSYGRRPTITYIPNYRHEKADDVDFVRGYGFQVGGAIRPNSGTTAKKAGIGAQVKAQARQPMPWSIGMTMFGEMLPYYDNHATLHPNKTDKWGIALIHVDAYGRDNERKMMVQAAKDAEEMLIAGGAENVTSGHSNLEDHIMLGARTHEMGGACMGRDPKTSYLNKWAQSHDVPNLFVTDGACMASCATANPSLTYMAITARSANYAAKLMTGGTL